MWVLPSPLFFLHLIRKKNYCCCCYCFLLPFFVFFSFISTGGTQLVFLPFCCRIVKGAFVHVFITALELKWCFLLFSSRLDANTATLPSSKLPSESRTHTHLPILENTYQVTAILFGQSGTLSVRFMLVLSTSSPVAMVPCKVAAENLSLYLSSFFLLRKRFLSFVSFFLVVLPRPASGSRAQK